MGEIERVIELKEKVNQLGGQWVDQKRVVTNKLYSILNDLNLGPAPLLLRENQLVEIRDYTYPEQEGFKWEVTTTVHFVNQDPTHPTRDSDFGSDFYLYITNQKISINHGSCGTWDLSDKGQWSRLILMKAIFDHQQDIIDALNPLIDFKVKEAYDDVRCELERIERSIREAEEEKKKKEILANIKPGMYFANKGYHYVYDGKSDTSHKEKYYYGHQKIIKIAEKNFIVENSWGERSWMKIDNTVWNIQNYYLFVVGSKDEVPPQE